VLPTLVEDPSTRRSTMKMKAAAVVVAAFAALAFAPATSASASTTHSTEDVTGSVFSCATHTYTLSGEIRVVTHSSADAQGREHFTLTATTTGVTAVDENRSPLQRGRNTVVRQQRHTQR
jgi:hypothetical protein